MRNPTIDVMKGVGISLVVLGHVWTSPELLQKIIYAFHMPLFFVISGYLFNETKRMEVPFQKFLLSRFQRLYLPALVIGFSCAIPFYYFNKYSGIEDFLIRSFGIVYSVPLVEYTFNCTPIWFLSCLLCVEVLYYLICKYVKWNRLAVIGIIFSMGVIVSRNFQVFLPLNLSIAASSLVFLYLGTKLRSIDFIERHQPHWIFMVLAGCILCLTTILNPVKVGFAANRLGDLNYLFLGSFSGIYVVYFVSEKIKFCRWISFLGQNTILILGYNYWAYFLVRVILNKFDLSHWLLNFSLQIFLFLGAAALLKKIPYANCLLQGVPISNKRRDQLVGV